MLPPAGGAGNIAKIAIRTPPLAIFAMLPAPPARGNIAFRGFPRDLPDIPMSFAKRAKAPAKRAKGLQSGGGKGAGEESRKQERKQESRKQERKQEAGK